ncbi:MAG TPA: hypothetical protein VK669_00775 [Candidatus Limnocylindrales bacterium]|nr:hypothetical protein [Candidatus Limnocylindrales bacterium]
MRVAPRRLAVGSASFVLSLAVATLAACSGGGATTSAGPGTVTPVVTTTPTPQPPATPSPAPPTPVPSASPSSTGRVPSVGGCRIFPADNPWNTDVSSAPVDPNSAAYLASMNAATTNLHPDFGSNPTYGIPYTTVGAGQQPVPVSFDYASESDPGPYPIPPNAPVEGGPGATGDRHVLVVDTSVCKLYELYAAQYVGPGWHAGSGAVFDLGSNALRPDYWTSADAAGLPILAGLVRYDEAAQNGEIDHALRFTVRSTQRAFIHPATHYASSSTNAALPPMGLRVRLKASYDVSRFTGASRAVLVALKKYGMLVADNGSDWYVSGATDARWDDNDLNQLKSVPASAFEVVQTGTIIR